MDSLHYGRINLTGNNAGVVFNHHPGTAHNRVLEQEVHMIRLIKVLLIGLRNKPDQQFVNELYVHEQAKHYQRHAGVGNGPRDLPDGKYLKHNTKMFH